MTLDFADRGDLVDLVDRDRDPGAGDRPDPVGAALREQAEAAARHRKALGVVEPAPELVDLGTWAGAVRVRSCRMSVDYPEAYYAIVPAASAPDLVAKARLPLA
jgi:hypothetical protein